MRDKKILTVMSTDDLIQLLTQTFRNQREGRIPDDEASKRTHEIELEIQHRYELERKRKRERELDRKHKRELELKRKRESEAKLQEQKEHIQTGESL